METRHIESSFGEKDRPVGFHLTRFFELRRHGDESEQTALRIEIGVRHAGDVYRRISRVDRELVQADKIAWTLTVPESQHGSVTASEHVPSPRRTIVRLYVVQDLNVPKEALRRVDRRRRITESAVDFSRPVGEYFGRLFVGNDVLEFQPALQKNKEHKQDHGRAETREGDRGAYESLCGRGGYRLRRRCFTGGQGRGQRIATGQRGGDLKR